MAAWGSALPRLVGDVLADWKLARDGDPSFGETALVLPVVTESGAPAAAKFGWPHPEVEHAHVTLRTWAGDGAVRLLRADPRRSVLLLERLDPERDLHQVGVVEASLIVAGLYARLHRPPLPQLERLSRLADRWSSDLPRLSATNLLPRRLVDQAAALARDFAADLGTDRALIHTDLHYGNVLAGGHEPWLAIDPKPLAGDPAYEVGPLLWNRWPEAVASRNIRDALLERMYTVVDAAGLDEDRVRNWVTVRAVLNVWWSVVDSPSRLGPDEATQATTIAKAVQR